MSTVTPSQLRAALEQHFNLEELQRLCFELSLDYENLAGSTKEAKTMSLVEYAQRHNRLSALLSYVQTARPDWQFAGVGNAPFGSLALFPLHQLPLPNPSFVGREELLARLEAGAAADGAATVLTQAIAGLGGVGKSQLALAYAHAHRDQYDLIYWLTADPESSLLDGLRGLGRRLGLPVDAMPDSVAAAQQTVVWLEQTPRRWLLIVDNADDLPPSRLRQLLPGAGRGRVLITSRNPHWQGVVAASQLLRVDIFTPAEAVAYLAQELAAQPLGFDPAEGEVLAEALGYLPLALTHAAAYLQNSPHQRCADYVRLFRQHQAGLLARAERPHDYHATVTTTWQIAFDHVATVPGAADLLALCSCLAAEAIPLGLLRGLGEVEAGRLWQTVLGDELQFDAALAALHRYSLLTLGGEGVVLHRLVQMVARGQLGEAGLAEWVAVAAALLHKKYNFDRHDMATWPAGAALLPHLRAVAELAAAVPIESNEVAYLNNEIGSYLQVFISHAQAKPYYERALAIYEKVLGGEHPDTATSLNNLGVLLQAMGDYTGAKLCYERALAICEKVLGGEHPDTASSLNNLGGLLQATGDYVKAKSYVERALAICEKVLGGGHPFTALGLNNLGELLRAMGEYAGAKPYYERALAIWENVLGGEHLDTAQSLNNLGTLLRAMGEYDEAVPYFERAMQIRKKALGTAHPDFATSLWWLGVLAADRGERQQARDYVAQAYAIYEQALGANHPTTQSVYRFLQAMKV
ncbi:MAG: tetratricopeptide repeat protein [Anaerolineales bacterium]|nr:tetratricopeptide repeat protein [Anaerolineales bacterium]